MCKYIYAPCLWDSTLFTMKRLVSKKRSTQLTKQLSSPRENRVEGVPVMHLWRGERAGCQ